MSTEELNTAKQKMKDYRDIFGNELNRKDLINDAKNLIDLDEIFGMHYDHIEDMASDAQSSLDKFKSSLGVF